MALCIAAASSAYPLNAERAREPLIATPGTTEARQSQADPSASAGGSDGYPLVDAGTGAARFTIRQGLREDGAQAVATDADGALWISNTHALNKFDAGKFLPIRVGASADVHEYTAISVDAIGRIWVGIDGGLAVMDHEQLTRVPGRDGLPVGLVMDMAQAPDGTTWVLAVGKPRRLLHIAGLRVVAEFGVPKVNRLLYGPDNNLWLATTDGTLARYGSNKLDIVFAPESRAGGFTELQTGPSGQVIAAGRQGLVEWMGGRVRRLTVSNGLPCNTIYSAQFDQKGALWLYAKCGLVRVQAEDLGAWRKSATHRLTPTIVDPLDGVQGFSSNFGKTSARTRDGRLWFANGVQLQMVEPDLATPQCSARRERLTGHS